MLCTFTIEAAWLAPGSLAPQSALRASAQKVCERRRQPMADDEGEGDLLDVLALVGVGGEAAPLALAAPAALVAAAHVCGGDVQAAQNGAVAAALGPPIVAKWERRSPLLLQHARTRKALKATQAKLEEAKMHIEHRDEQLRLAVRIPGVAKLLGLRHIDRSFDRHRATHFLSLAFSSRYRGAATAGIAPTQAHATSVVAAACVDFMQNSISEQFQTPRHGGCVKRLGMLTCQFDEAQQRLQAIAAKPFKGERRSHAQVVSSVQVMSGHAHSREIGSNGQALGEENLPWFGRCLRLEAQTADCILEGLARGVPSFVDSARFREAACGNDDFIMLFACDRAAANFKAIRWVSQYIAEHLPSHVLPWVEVCGSHGIAIVKTRCHKRKTLSSAAFSLSRLMRIGKNTFGLREVIIKRVFDELQLMPGPRPVELQPQGDLVIKMLYSHDTIGQAYLFKKHKDGSMHKSSFCKDLEQYVKHVDFASLDDGVLRFWCPVDGETGEASPISREDACERTCTAILNMVCGHAWNTAQSGRWIHVTEVLKRLFFLLPKNILGRALSDLRAHFRQTDSFDALARMIEQDSENVSAKYQLRLLRVIHAFARDEVKMELAITIIVSRPVDDLLYKFLGHDKLRINLTQLLDPADSPLCSSQQALVTFASAFNSEAMSAWSLLGMVGCNMVSPVVRLAARRELLQLSGGLLEVFELRFSHPPYSLVLLDLQHVTVEHKNEILNFFFKEDVNRMSLLCKRLRQKYDTRSKMLHSGSKVVRFIADKAPISIDFSERTHAAMRTDVASEGPACSATFSANRVLCAQVKTAFTTQGGKSVLPAMPAASDANNDGLRPAKKRRGGGSAYLSYHNHRLAAIKRILSPDIPLSQQQLCEAKTKIRDEWAVIVADPARYNTWLDFFRHANVRGIADAGVPEEIVEVFEPLWGMSESPDSILPADRLLEWYQRQPWFKSGVAASEGEEADLRDVLALADCDRKVVESPLATCWSNNDLTVRFPPPARADVGQGQGNDNEFGNNSVLFGAYSSLKHVDLAALSAEQRQAHEYITTLLNRWVDSLGAATAKLGDSLFTIEPDGGDGLCVAFLLVVPKYKPKAQILHRCLLDGQSVFQPLTTFPVDFELGLRSNRLSKVHYRQWMAFDLLTTDEMALELVSRSIATHWKLKELDYDINCNLPSLLWMRIKGARPFAMPARTAKPASTSTVSKAMQSVLELDLNTGFGDLGPANGGGGAEPIDDGFPEEELIDDPDVAEDVRDVMAQDMGVGAIADPSEVDGVADDAAPDPDGVADDAAPDPDSEGPSARELGQSATLQPNGYVVSEVEPWASAGVLGRLTDWPEHKQFHQRSLSMKCRMHGSACAFVTTRSKATNADMLEWLFLCKPLTSDAAPAQVAAAKAEHLAAAQRFKATASFYRPDPVPGP